MQSFVCFILACLALVVAPVYGAESKREVDAKKCRKLLPDEYQWQARDWSHLQVTDLPRALKIFPEQQPDCALHAAICADAESKKTIVVDVDVFFKDSAIWNRPEQLPAYMALVNRYYQQASISFNFKFRPANELPAWTGNRHQLTVIFASAMPNPAGKIADAFGNLPAGKAVFNDVLMNRQDKHANPYFMMGKPLGHELGHVLGLAHTQDKALLMTQGTSPQNALDILPEQALIMRVMALQRFGGKFDTVPACH
ncbi:hypothetical protein DFR42_12046 [Undibacterium pigrum]|uniref:Matrixin n=2 Tax=Undibacterium pigrum TaxID=401470 RepID=A0A318IQB1_9BURK|nr:hypothetical protein DFR42_12046 [Undibacterium pigrum]